MLLPVGPGVFAREFKILMRDIRSPQFPVQPAVLINQIVARPAIKTQGRQNRAVPFHPVQQIQVIPFRIAECIDRLFNAEEADPIYAPDGETIYFTRIDTTGPAIWRIGVLGGQARKIVSNARIPVPSSDGRNLAYILSDSDSAGDALVVGALDGSSIRTLARGILGTFVTRPAWSPEGRWLSYVRGGLFAPNNLFAVEVSTGQERQVTQFNRSGEGVQPLAWLPDNHHLVVSYVPQRTFFQSDLGVLEIEGGSISRLTFNVPQGFSSLSVSADGTRLIATADQTSREVWKVPLGPDPDANGRTAVRLLESSQDPMWTFASRDGRTLLFNNATYRNSQSVDDAARSQCASPPDHRDCG